MLSRASRCGTGAVPPARWALAILLCWPLCCAAGDHRYCHARFGFCVDYHYQLTMEPPPDNDDGRALSDRSGFRMVASGINNALESSLEEEMARAAESFDRVTYRRKGRGWYALSGFAGGDILYVKSWVGAGAINSLHLRYPAALKTRYDEVVTRVGRSFRPGPLGEPH